MVRAIEFFGRLTRAHALLMTCTCAALLLFNPLSQRSAWPTFGWANSSSTANADEIDATLQRAAEAALADRGGAIIVMDAQTGRVRAAVNPEAAYRQAMMPGSSIKPFTTIAALRSGLIDEDSRTVCPGRFTGLSFSLPCTHADHLPPFNSSQAIAYSCNYYFATLGQRLNRDALVETLRQFGFGRTTGIGDGEAPGIIRSCEGGDVARMRSVASDQASQQADCAAREAIGESDYVQVTPIQLLSAYAALLNGGHLFQPQTASERDLQASERARVSISDAERRIVFEGMSGAIRYGTARGAKLDSLPLTIIGKTGTALPPKGFRTNGWFVGLAGPADADTKFEERDVQLAVMVFLPRAHGAEAAKVSRPIFEAYANAVSQADTAPQNQSSLKDGSEAAASTVTSSASSIKVHLVRDNITRELSLEDYVLGVMRAEGATETEPEALKALAIAIRTYALKNAGRHAKDGYDFCSTTHCQRFVSERSSSPTVREGAVIDAVRATEGRVLLDERGQLIDSYFGASCGGETANVATLWGTAPAVYLKGGRDEFCESGPHAHWTDVISRVDLLRALQTDSRTDIGHRLDQVTISKRDDTGRAEFITLEGEQRKIVRGWDFKIIVGRALGWNVLKSSRFDVSRAGPNFIFRGSGFGHGLGLCQEGAHVMAARGSSYERILEKYFPGTSVKPRSGDVSLARPFKAETDQKNHCLVAPATIEDAQRQVSLTRRATWIADVLPALKGWAKVTRRFAAHHSAFRFLTISSEHFRVTYPADSDSRDANRALTLLESARADYLRRAGNAGISVGGLPLLEIRFNDSTGNFVGRTGQPWWAAAATKGRSIELQPLAILKRRGVLNTTLKHELAHVLIDVVSRGRAPRWLEEGFAIYLAGEGAMYSRARRGALSDDELEQRLARPRSQSDMHSSYADAYVRVTEMVRNGGEAGVWTKLADS